MENAKIEKFKCDILGDFQTLWIYQVNLVNERNHGFGFETEETKVVSVSTETNFGFLLTETH